MQLVDHLKENDLYEIFQSAYRQLHSTETALLRVQYDIPDNDNDNDNDNDDESLVL